MACAQIAGRREGRILLATGADCALKGKGGACMGHRGQLTCSDGRGATCGPKPPDAPA